MMVTGRGRARRRAARRGAGASAPTSPSTSPTTIRSRALRGRRPAGCADVVVDVTAKAPAAFAQAVALARAGGTIVVAGTRGGRRAPGFQPDHIVYKELP